MIVTQIATTWVCNFFCRKSKTLWKLGIKEEFGALWMYQFLSLVFFYVDAIRVIRHIFNMLTSYTNIFRNMYFLCIYFIYTLMIYIN
ncbi:hypothetical protein HanPSC8_Chr02g0079971 [Helianthus annuus]|nr:hypothetical protein HanPSC8_Chr02g0079971 [Helianthus annuus]